MNGVPQIATPVGQGCRVEGPHGPNPCGQNPLGCSPDVLDGSECSCGCSAFEDVCDAYAEWLHAQQQASAVRHPKRGS